MVAVTSLSEADRGDLAACCPGIAGLLEWLESLGGRPGLQELGERLEAAEINLDAVKRHIDYTDIGYQRNIILTTEHFEMVLITWKPGQDTPIHDHEGSDCAFQIVLGETTETIYELNAAGLAVPVAERIYLPGTVCAAGEPDIHRISNETEGDLINLHIYTPPLDGFRVYDAA